MDLGGRRALGIRAIPLRTLGLCRKTAGAGCRDRLRSGRCTRQRLVAFVGGAGIAIGGGPGVAWFPLAPGEVYVPYYRGSRGYVERLNVTNTVVNVTRVTNVYNIYNRTATSRTSRTSISG